MAKNNSDEKETDRRVGVLMKLYEINYDYQNQKEQRLWLLFSVYITILLAAIGWIAANPHFLRSFLATVLFGCVLFLFSVFTIVYISHQNWLKAWSVERDYRMQRIIKRFDAEVKPTYKEIVLAAFPGKERPNENNRCRIFFRNGWSGTIIISITFVITIAEIVLLVLYLSRTINAHLFRLWR